MRLSGFEKEQSGFIIETTKGEIWSRFVINAAGVYADHIARMVGIDDFRDPTAQWSILVVCGSGKPINSVIFQLPTDKGKGVLLTSTYYGNLDRPPMPAMILRKMILRLTFRGLLLFTDSVVSCTTSSILGSLSEALPAFALGALQMTSSLKRAGARVHQRGWHSIARADRRTGNCRHGGRYSEECRP